MLIVLWLQRNSGVDIYIPYFLPNDWKDFGTAHLVLWLLLGSLYCYIASYPALVFHATRVLDFRDVQGQLAGRKYLSINPYLCSTFFAIAAGVCAFFNTTFWAFLLVAVFSGVQIARILIVAFAFGDFGLKRDLKAKFSANISYAYLRKLSERRAITTRDKVEPEDPKNARNKFKERTIIRKDEKDIVDSYRHLREHGNTALIVLLEIALCPVLYVFLESQVGVVNKIWFCSVLILWVLPSVLIHGLAQQLERRFSWFKYSLESRGTSDQIEEPRD
jgi:hypothetical protein